MADATPADPRAHGVFGSATEDGVFRVLLRGDLDLGGRDRLDAVTEAFRASGCRHVILDLSRLTVLNARGLTFMAALERHCRSLGGTATIIDPGHDVTELLTIAGLAPRFTLVSHPSRGDAHVPGQRSAHPLDR